MKLLYWSDSWWPSVGGIEVLGSQCLSSLKRRGFEPLVLTSQTDRNRPVTETLDGIPIHRLPFAEALQSRNLDLFTVALHQVRKLKQDWAPDVIHLNFPAPSGIFHLQTAKASPAPLLLSMHTYAPDWETGKDTLSGKLTRECSWLAANSKATREAALRACPSIGDRSSVVYNGLQEPDLPRSLLPFDPPIMACAGRLIYKKGLDVAIRAFAALRTQMPIVRLRIAGEGPERKHLERLAEELGVADCVEFHGWVAPENMAAWINQATVVVVPSRSMEPFGNVAVEAMQMGRPVVATDQGGLPEVVADGETGLIVNAEDIDQLVDRVSRLLQDPALAARLGAAGCERARAQFNLDRYVDSYEKLYRKLVE